MDENHALDDPHDLQRFLAAQEPVLAAVRAELEAGAKRTHWMWFVFPQLAGLGRSATARRYGIADAAEARAYLAHPVLGERLRTLVATTLRHAGRSATEIFGTPDDMKFRSCLTLFHDVATDEADRALFGRALAAFYGGEPDPQTRSLLGGA